MGYIGNEPTTGHFPVDNFTSSGGSTYTLAKAPASAGAIEVSVQGVLQPTTAYTVSGTTLTMAGVTTGVKIFVRHLGETLSLPTPADGSVTTTKLGTNSVDGTKIAMGSDARGDILYHGASDYARLAKGTSGQILTMGANDPAWATAAGGGAWTVIANTTVTSTASIAFTGFDASIYDSYQLRICNIQPATNIQDLNLRTSTNGGSSYDSGGSDYHHNWMQMRTNTQDNDHDAADSQIKLTGNQGCASAANRLVSAVVDISFPAEAAYTTFSWKTVWSGNTEWCVVSGFGERMSAADVDAIQLFFSSGNFAAKGKIQLLGIKKS